MTLKPFLLALRRDGERWRGADLSVPDLELEKHSRVCLALMILLKLLASKKRTKLKKFKRCLQPLLDREDIHSPFGPGPTVENWPDIRNQETRVSLFRSKWPYRHHPTLTLKLIKALSVTRSLPVTCCN